MLVSACIALALLLPAAHTDTGADRRLNGTADRRLGTADAPPPPAAACAAALTAGCAADKAKGTAQCVACVAAHDKNLTAAGCTTVDKMGFCSGQPPTPPPPLGGRPTDCPCITWQQGSCHSGLNGPLSAYPPDIYIYSAYEWHPSGSDSGSCTACNGQPGRMECAYIFPCFNSDVNVWGHHDVLIFNQGEPCNAQGLDGKDSQTCNQWWPGNGPKADMFGWQLTQQGSPPDQHAGKLIEYDGLYLARSVQASPYENCGTGNVGWVQLQKDGTLGCMEYAANNLTNKMCNSYEVAICKACKPCPLKMNETNPPGCPPCPKPPPKPPPPPPPPPAPPGGQPCIRFGHALPTSHHVEVEIKQGSISYSWKDYHFGEFSGWVDEFTVGTGTFTVWESSGGTKGSQLMSTQIPLTPGPLVVVIKDACPDRDVPGSKCGAAWPPTKPTAVETIAASFVPPKTGSAIRLFNLAADIHSAGLTNGAKKVLVSDVKFTLGSVWMPIPASADSFTATDKSQAKIVTATMTPPDAPQVFTAFLLGTKEYGYTLMPQIDAPEYGPCRPGGASQQLGCSR